VVMEKDEAVYLTLLNQITHRGLSPSQISRYIRCPLMFYFSFVASLDEALPFEETIDLMELGTLVHATLQEMYSAGLTPGAKPQESGAVLDDSFFGEALPKVRGAVMERMQHLIGGGAHVTGRNLIIAEVADFMVSRFLENEREAIKENGVEVLAVELELEYTVTMASGIAQPTQSDGRAEDAAPVDAAGISLRFKGVADRVDRCNHTVRITDYKTGKVEPADLKWKSLDELFALPAKQKAFQLMFYCWLYDRTHRPAIPVNGGVFTLKNPSTFLMMMPALQDMAIEGSRMLLDRFEEGLFSLCGEILNRDIPFVQTEDATICRTCPYHPICQTDKGER
jgi:ATP-dependent helicase/nuclease subunit B